MEQESFEDSEVADVLNQYYVAIKVDREERKDLDAIYMKACQVITGTGGWPLNVWLTPDKLPIYAGTYFPKKSFSNRTGLMDALKYLHQIFRDRPQELFNKSFEIITKLKKIENRREGTLKSSIIEEVNQDFKTNFNPIHGGFSKAPKFPTPHQLMYVLNSRDIELQNMGVKTAEQMAKGGIYDHLGGGFSRYSVDEQWLIPHFEKMLYDNGLLLDVYSKAYELSENEAFKVVVQETCDFLARDLRNEEGGFYTAYDADSEGVEGKFYRFSQAEILSVLGEEDGLRFCDAYTIKVHGNFEGYTVLNLLDGQLATFYDTECQILRKKLFKYREQRIKPALDDKILSMSNAYAIHGILSAYETFQWAHLLELAIDAEAYIVKYMIADENLYASVREHIKGPKASIEDYGALIRSELKLFMITQKDAYLNRALELLSWAERYFWDEEDLGYFVGIKGSKELIYNPKELYDGATPSGNSLMMNNLMIAFLLTSDIAYQERMNQLVDFFGAQLNQYKIYASYFLSSIRSRNQGTTELTIAVPNEQAKELFLNLYSYGMIREKYTFDTYRLEVNKDKCINQHTTVYLCHDGTCEQPILFS